MTEMAEPVVIAQLNHEDHDESTCAFCTSPQKPISVESEIPGLNDAGMAHKNNAGKNENFRNLRLF